MTAFVFLGIEPPSHLIQMVVAKTRSAVYNCRLLALVIDKWGLTLGLGDRMTLMGGNDLGGLKQKSGESAGMAFPVLYNCCMLFALSMSVEGHEKFDSLDYCFKVRG